MTRWMATPMTEAHERRRVRREVLRAGRWRDDPDLPYTEGPAVLDRGLIGPARP
jgi:hypothetical protein